MRYERQLGLGVVALALLGGLLFLFEEEHTQAPIREIETKALPLNHMASLAKRPVFPYSVVPGGTKDGLEAQQMAQMDPAVRRHYAPLDLKRLSPVQVTKGTSAYLSYRIGKRIYWTSKRLYLREGEKLLSDGKLLLRARCGNRVSLEPMQPTLAHAEPSEAELDLPSWDSPLFQAMLREANTGADLGLFDLPGAGPQGIETVQTNLPDSLFGVLPDLLAGNGGGPIGGTLPGGLSGIRNPDGIVVNGGNFFGGVVTAGVDLGGPPCFEDLQPPVLPGVLFPALPLNPIFRVPDLFPPVLLAGNLLPVGPGFLLPGVVFSPIVSGDFPPILLPGGGGGTDLGVVVPPGTGPGTGTGPGGGGGPGGGTGGGGGTGPGGGGPGGAGGPGGDMPTLEPAQVPEPATFWLLLLSLALLLFSRRSG